MRHLAVLAAVGAALAVATGAADSRQPLDYARVARNVLPPGQSGSVLFPPTATDQLRLYDGLTPKRGAVTAADLRRYFKSARFGPDGRATRTARPRRGVRIVRDRWGVPHVYGRTRDDVMFGAGWATAEDRGLLMNLLRGPGRISALDVPGLNAFALATSARTFVPSAQTERFLSRQVDLLRASGADGRRVLRDVDAYVAGINAYNRSREFGIVWSRNDVIAVATLIGAVFGSGGGDEARAAQLLDALRDHLGAARGERVWDDLRLRDDPESAVAVPGRFPYGTASGRSGNVVLDAGSFAAPEPARLRMSNALLIGRSRSASGRPLFVAGPQTGHAFPQILMELDLHGGGIDARGAAFPGVSLYVLVGRGRDYAWSATSANSDIVDTYVEELCGDDLHYQFRGECRAMTTFDAGVLLGRGGEADRRITFRETVHGPVTGYATVDGRRVALSSRRSTRGREVLSARWFADLNANRVTSARSFLERAHRMEMTFNWLYADDRDIAQFTSGRLPVRGPGVDTGLPTLGTGQHEWRGWVPQRGHAQAVNPPGGAAPPHPAERRRRHEPRGDPGPAGRRRLAGGGAGAGGRRRPDAAGAARSRPRRRVASRGGAPARSRPRRLDRPRRRGGAGRGVAADLPRRLPARARAGAGAVLRAGAMGRHARPRRERLRGRLVLARGQGPARRLRPPGCGALPGAVLRRGRPRRLPRLAVAGARRGGGGAGGRAGA